MEKLREFCKKNGLHIIAEEDNDLSILAVDQKAGSFVVIGEHGYIWLRRYTIEGGLKVYFAPNSEVRIETLPVKKTLTKEEQM